MNIEDYLLTDEEIKEYGRLYKIKETLHLELFGNDVYKYYWCDRKLGTLMQILNNYGLLSAIKSSNKSNISKITYNIIKTLQELKKYDSNEDLIRHIKNINNTEYKDLTPYQIISVELIKAELNQRELKNDQEKGTK